MQVEMDPQEQSQLLTNIKLYAVIENNLVVDGWLAHTLEEACRDNPGKGIVQLNDSNSPQYINSRYSGNKNDIVYIKSNI